MSEYEIQKFLKPADFITIFHAIIGFLSIVFSLSQNFVTAAFMLLFSAFLDFIDGKVARLVGKKTEFGKAIDFADLISFGIAPAVMISLIIPGKLTYMIASGFVVSSLLRLARFNISKVKFSIGMGTAFNGVIFPLLFLAVNYFKIDSNIYLVVMILSSYLMLSSFKLKK